MILPITAWKIFLKLDGMSFYLDRCWPANVEVCSCSNIKSSRSFSGRWFTKRILWCVFLRDGKTSLQGFYTIPGNSVVCIEAIIQYGQSKAPWKGMQHCWMSHVASVCTPCCMLLRVVGSCCAIFETGQTFSYVQTDATTPNYVMSVCTGLKQKIGGEFSSHCLPNITYEDINWCN